MQATTVGPNMTGAALIPGALKAMNDAADALTPFEQPDATDRDAQKMRFIEEAEAVGSVPSPTTLKGAAKAGVAKLTGSHPAILLDKLGERLAFERSGTRLYDALIVKYRASRQLQPGSLPPADRGDGASQEDPLATLENIRADELAHFNMLCDAMRQLGGDPTAQTPCADVSAVASSGLMQVVNDPRTTLAQCLSAVLTAELTDNAGWELLISLAEESGQSDLVGQFLAALAQEQQHLSIIKHWLSSIVAEQPEPSLV